MWRAFRRSGRPRGCACVLRPFRPAPAPAPASRCWPGSSRCRSPRCRAATTRRGGPSSTASARQVLRSAVRGFWSPPKTPASSAFATGLRRVSAGRSRTRRQPASPLHSRQACAATCRRRRMAQSGMPGLAHLLAISGLHLGLVAGLVFAAVRAALALWPGVALRYPVKKWAAAAAIAAGLFYMLPGGRDGADAARLPHGRARPAGGIGGPARNRHAPCRAGGLRRAGSGSLCAHHRELPALLRRRRGAGRRL